MSLMEAKKTDVFTWFHLVESGPEKDATGRRVVFHPEGKAFRKLVTVKVTLDSQDRVDAIDLLLARSFVNDKKQGVFASDIAKSLLLSAIPNSDQPAIKVLTDEIQSNEKSDATVLSAEPGAETPYKASPGYLTYLGKRYLYTQDLTGSTLRMENLKQDDTDLLRIAVALKGKAD